MTSEDQKPERKSLTSGFWITLSVPFFLIRLLFWELLQLYRRRQGNDSALTLSQYTVRNAKKGNRLMLWYILVLPVLLLLIGSWLLLHLCTLCLWFDVACNLEINFLDIGGCL